MFRFTTNKLTARTHPAVQINRAVCASWDMPKRQGTFRFENGSEIMLGYKNLQVEEGGYARLVSGQAVEIHQKLGEESQVWGLGKKPLPSGLDNREEMQRTWVEQLKLKELREAAALKGEINPLDQEEIAVFEAYVEKLRAREKSGGEGVAQQRSDAESHVVKTVPGEAQAVKDIIFLIQSMGGRAIVMARILTEGTPRLIDVINRYGGGLIAFIERHPDVFELFQHTNGGTYVALVYRQIKASGLSVMQYTYEYTRKTKEKLFLDDLNEEKELRDKYNALVAQRRLEKEEKEAGEFGEVIPRGARKFRKKKERDEFLSKEQVEALGGSLGALAAASKEALVPIAPPTSGDEERIKIIKAVQQIVRPGEWIADNHVQNALFPSPEDKDQGSAGRDFRQFLEANPSHFWAGPKGLFTLRCEGQEIMPIVTKEDYDKATAAGTMRELVAQTQKLKSNEGKPFVLPLVNNESVAAKKVVVQMSPLPYREFDGWGSDLVAPTPDDVYEVLKYVPIQWMDLSNLTQTLPPKIKNQCIRMPSTLEWLRRQPQFFDVRRFSDGSVEVRRSVLLHPEKHGLTKDAAQAIVDEQVKEIEAINNPSSKKADDGSVSISSTTNTTTTVEVATSNSGASVEILDVLTRAVASNYFVSAKQAVAIARQQLSSPDVSLGDVLNAVKQHSPSLGVTHIPSATTPTLGEIHLISRKDPGAECELALLSIKEAHKKGFGPEVLALVEHSCVLWDRTQYLYVRLPDEVKTILGGFESMVKTLQRYPHLFKVGPNGFYRRATNNEAFEQQNSQEPSNNTVPSSSSNLVGIDQQPVLDNPYALNDQAVPAIFHYVSPTREQGGRRYNLAQYVECSSPAMRAVLPPRLLGVFERNPQMFRIHPGNPEEIERL